MKAHRNLITRIMTLVLGFVLCGLPDVAQALPQQSTAPQNQQQSGTTIDPSEGPLQPVPSQNEPSTLSAEHRGTARAGYRQLPLRSQEQSSRCSSLWERPPLKECRRLAAERRGPPEKRLRPPSRISGGRC